MPAAKQLFLSTMSATTPKYWLHGIVLSPDWKRCPDLMPKIEYPLPLGRGLNDREHYMARNRRVRREKETVGWLLKQHKRPAVPCTFTMTRIAPSVGLDIPNLGGAFKAVVDAIADWMGVDDRFDSIVHYEFKQARGQWGLRVEWE